MQVYVYRAVLCVSNLYMHTYKCPMYACMNTLKNPIYTLKSPQKRTHTHILRNTHSKELSETHAHTHTRTHTQNHTHTHKHKHICTYPKRLFADNHSLARARTRVLSEIIYYSLIPFLLSSYLKSPKNTQKSPVVWCTLTRTTHTNR